MNIPNLNHMKNLVGIGKAFFMTHRPELLLAAATTGTIASTVLAARGGYKARGIVDAEQERRDMEEKSAPLTTKEKAQLTWQCYLPSAYALTGSLGSQVGLHLVHVKEKKALVVAGAAAMEELRSSANDYFKELREASSEHLTEKELEEVEKNARHNHLMKGADEQGHVQVYGKDGVIEELYLIRDAKTGRDIFSNKRRIEQAVLDLNNVLSVQGDCELNTFYQYAGFPSIPEGEEAGWSGALVDVAWKDTHREDGRPVREFYLRPFPEKGYNSNYA